jgi:DNA-binding CsgD family transcriptional regulator
LQQQVAQAHTYFSFIAQAQHDSALAHTQLLQALAISRELDDKPRIAENLLFLGILACEAHDYVDAQALYAESLALFQALGDDWSVANTLVSVGQLAQAQGDYAQAGAIFKESLTRWRAMGTLQWKGVTDCLEGLASLCVVQHQFETAARLFGAAGAAWELRRAALSPFVHASAADKLSALHLQLDEAAFVAAWAEGRRLTPEQAVDYALALPNMSVTASSSVVPPPPAYPAGLTAREVEVLRLLAHGLTYVQIADKLVVSRRTINAHIGSIYSKLAVNSRAEATRFAVDHHLV